MMTRLMRKIKRKIWYFAVVRPLIRKGFSSYMAYAWPRMIMQDLKNEKDHSLREKIWAFRRGLRPWRIPQYGITKENYKEFLSDRDYCYLHPINNSFVKWINDKVTMRYVLEPFSEYLPKYYFHLLARWGGKTDVVPLADLPEGYEPSFEGVLKLLRDKGDLAYKMSSGTHGIGFRKLSYRAGGYLINNEACEEEDIINLFETRTVFYTITEYIQMHSMLKEIYPESVNTIRVMAINEDGLSPFVCEAFMRIGSITTGVTDNVGFGGVFAKIDIETGRYYDGEQVINHVITKSPHHPDTEVLIEGVIPHWDIVLEKIHDICKFMPQLEYMGFDIAITEEGFVIIEINVHQDLHRYPLYRQEVKDYFFRKLEKKQARHGQRYKRI